VSPVMTYLEASAIVNHINQLEQLSAADSMGLPDKPYVSCGEPFDSRYDELMEGVYPDAGRVRRT
jgi:hypothetical protein